MALPKKLKNFIVFNDAKSYLGQATEIVLPKLSRKMEAYRAGGMNGEVNIDLGQEMLEAEMTLGGMMRQVFDQYASTKVDGVLLRFSGAYQEDSTGTVSAIEVVMRGRHKEIDMGTAKVGDSNDIKVSMSLSYYKLTIDGLEVIEIDMTNMVEKVNGVDRLAEQRKAIGLSA